ncbi:amidase [Amycolatopsis rubida]|uniref:Amidase n=1 Tax=Amycolatopsis rubida TaxID=112413 RepID=A0ABX0C3J5_9PSEU|nr:MULTISPECIES: amidase [Amycolatopsis]MYW96178.1 amidase [Amycolatopsis rubida]NEC61169.1 amidase [Amycolatopsis rubida]OAP24306.1 Acylamidase [Amycolatopsis sp. M39]
MGENEWFSRMDAVDLAAAVRSGELSPVEVVDAALDRIAEVDDRLNACCAVLRREARAAAMAAERALRAGEPGGPLCGVPVIVKDAIWVAGVAATLGSRALAHFQPVRDAVAVQRLRAAGAIVVAKSTNPEFLWRGYAAESLHGVTRNPWSLDRTPGATSGGSAVAVATGMVPIALGTDAAGSIRTPAAYCGVVGHKPTHGLVPRTPGFEELRTTNTIGPMARTTRDVALALEVMSGPDLSDDLGVRAGPSRFVRDSPKIEVARLRIAWAPRIHGAPDASVDAAVAKVAERLAGAGWRLDVVDPPVPDLTGIGVTSWLGELAELGELREDRLSAFGRHLLEDARRLSAREYYVAQVERARFTAAWDASLSGHDVLMMPAAPHGAPPFGPDRVKPGDGGRVGPSAIANLTGRPALSIPIGMTPDRLPIGLEIMARRGGDADCLAVAEAIERLGFAVPSPPIGRSGGNGSVKVLGTM